MADADDSTELLFFDTFSHEIHEDLNLDLVQFPQPVYITEVRIIPLGARVQADFPGGVRLGATNPSKFHIELFVNDLAKPGASTFERLGEFEYNQNDCIDLQCAKCTDRTTGDRQIPTDGLVLRGGFTTITLAVYGSVAKEPLVAVEQLSDALAVPSDIAITTDDGKIGDTPMEIDLVTAHLAAGPVPTTPQTPKDTARQYTENWVASTGIAAAALNAGQSTSSRTAAKSPDIDTWDADDDLNKSSSLISSPPDARRSPEYRRRRSYDRGVLDKKLLKTREYESRRSPPPVRMPRTPSPEVVQSPTARRPHTPEAQHPSKHKFYASSVQSPQSTTDAETDTPANTSGPIGSIPPAEPDEDALSQGEAYEPILSDEEIGDDTFEQQYDIEYDDADDANLNSALLHFNPFTEELKQYVPSDENMSANAKELIELATKCLHRSKLKEHQNVERTFIDSPSTEMKENWVHAAEQLIQIIALIYNLAGATRTRSQRALSTLISLNQHELVHWMKIGLSFECANSQQQPGYKIRHIKCGIRLIELIAADESFIECLIVREKFNIFDYLYRLYEQKFMALSIKLMVCKAIYACLDTRTGIEYFTERTLGCDDEAVGDVKLATSNGYQKLVKLLQENPLTRIKFALKSILKKVNLYESLHVIRDIVNRRLFADARVDGAADEAEMVAADQTLLKHCLNDIWAAYTWDAQSYTQPKRFLPISTKFEKVIDANATKGAVNSFFRYFSNHGLLESLLLLVSNNADPFVTEEVFDATLLLLESFCRVSYGLEYLSERAEVTNVLAKCLLQASLAESQVLQRADDEEMADVDASHIDDVGVDIDEDTRMHRLGLELSYKMRSIYCLNAIADITMATENREERLIEHFHCLYSLAVADGQIGRKHVVDTITMNDHIIVILKQMESEKKVIHAALTSAAANETTVSGSAGAAGANAVADIDAMKYVKGPILNYAIDLIDLTVRYSGTNLDYMRQHGQILLNLVKSYDQFESPISQILQELTIYLKPLENPNIFSYDNIGPLCEIVKRNLEFITTFPGDMITALRIIRYLAIPDTGTLDSSSDFADTFGDASAVKALAQNKNYSQFDQHQVELKYKFALLQFYSADGITTCTSILDKVCNYFAQPAVHTAALGTAQGTLATQILLPTMEILRKMLTYVIETRNTEYKDLTAIEPMLRTYTLINYVPTQATAADDAAAIQMEVVKALMAYTQPTPASGVDTESVHKSLWTQMIGELLKYIMTGPYTFLTGLSLLIQMLPIPLPLPTKHQLTNADRIVTDRHLWSAHLHSQSVQIAEMIQSLCLSSYGPLLDLLARVIGQLSDLAPNMALLTTKAVVFDVLLVDGSGSIASTPETNGEAAAQMALIATYINPQTKRVLALLSNILDYASVKAAFLSYLTPASKVYEFLIKILAAKSTSLPSAMWPLLEQQQQITLTILHTILNAEITLAPEMSLACALPPKDCLPGLIGAILDHFMAVDDVLSTFGSQFSALKTMIILTEHDYTTYQLRSLLDKRKDAVLAKLRSIERPSGNDTNAYEILLTLLLFVQSLVRTNFVAKNERTFVCTEADLVRVLQFRRPRTDDDGTVDTPIPQHPLLVLKTHLSDRLAAIDANVDEKAHIEEILFNLNNVLKALTAGIASIAASANGDSAQGSPAPEPSFPQADGIVAQYAQRPLYTVVCDEIAATSYADQLTTAYWCAKPSPSRFVDDDNQQTTSQPQQPIADMVPCDLIEMIKLCLPPETNLSSDCKRLMHLSASPQSTRERTTSAPCFRTRRVEVEPSTGREKKIYSRGRGFSRAPSSRGVSLFRSRPPNTSRPPSLHVDDFLALETCGAQPTGPTGYNKLAREIISIRGTRGGRGRGRILSSSGSPYRHSTLRRTNSPSTWTNHSLTNTGGSSAGDGGSSHFRTATAEPVHSSHFQSDYASPHFSSSSSSIRGRRGSMRPPRSFNRSS